VHWEWDATARLRPAWNDRATGPVATVAAIAGNEGCRDGPNRRPQRRCPRSACRTVRTGNECPGWVASFVIGVAACAIAWYNGSGSELVMTTIATRTLGVIIVRRDARYTDSRGLKVVVRALRDRVPRRLIVCGRWPYRCQHGGTWRGIDLTNALPGYCIRRMLWLASASLGAEQRRGERIA